MSGLEKLNTRLPAGQREMLEPSGLLADPAFFESVVVHATDVVLVTEAEPIDLADGGPRVIYVNPAFTRMTGFEPEDILGKTPRVLQSPRTDRRELDRLKAALKAWRPVEVELLNLRKDGTEFWVQLSITPVANAAGWYTHWIAIQREITARKKLELAVRTMLESTSDLMLVLDDEYRIVMASPTSEKVLGQLPGRLEGSDLLPLVHPEDRVVMQALLRPTLVPRFGRQATAEVRVQHGDGDWRWLEVNVAPLTDRAADAAASLVLACSDVTEYKRAKESLRELDRRFRSAFEDAPIGMAITDLSGNFLQVNGALAGLLGYPTQALLTMSVQDVTHPDDVQYAGRQRQALLRGDHDRRQHETRFVHADGTVVGILHSTSLVRDSEEAPALFIDHIEDITDRQAFENRLRHQALHDTLTALPNRALFMDRLHQALHLGDREFPTGTARSAGPVREDGRPGRHTPAGTGQVAVLFCDIDRFKAINDTYGHHIGDLVLTAVAGRLQNLIQATDTVARLGGDELVVLCPESGPEAVAAVASRILAAVQEPVTVGGHSIRVTLSVGTALADAGTTTAEQLLRNSDNAMYAAKEGGRNRYVVHEPELATAARKRLLLEQELPEAIREGQLTLHYQPQLDLVADRVVGVEALVRWDHPRLGLLPPGEFIELVEGLDLMGELDRWVLHTALAEAQLLRGKGEDAPVMWINVSASELEDPEFAARIEQALREHDLPGSALGLEITESVLMLNLSRAHLTLGRVRSLGVQLAIDDFGTGYSSLSYIAQFPVTVVKIDRSFISGLDDPERRRESFAIVTAVIGLAHSLQLTVVAEGIETPTQRLIAHGLGCDHGQGFLLGRPVPHER